MERASPPTGRDADPAACDPNVVPFRAGVAQVRLPEPSAPDKLHALFQRLTTRQHDLILAAAEIDGPTPHSIVRQIAELENAISAVAGLWAEREGTPR